MPNIGPMIAASGRLGLGYAERLLTDVTPNQFARFARIGDTVIQSNHAAFNYGHLSLYASKIIEGVGGDPSVYQPSEAFVEVFSKDATCVDDPDGDIYPSMQEVVDALVRNYTAAIEALEAADDEVFMKPNPNVSMRERFSTTGAMLGFYIGGHFMIHMGQTSAWRRAMGLGSA
ncbi:hypothetical protein CA13_32430 [Planctomycetes bacterium CA13]|uniref:DinB superfamily protein n=1 Tax=Novipirellula herctigrandis TaxID=2527986 RepID=A0A5C5Z3L8_9BACT|nr:hypothetical protein CA13_32430 [Planctomycetes bacterium CA13]